MWVRRGFLGLALVLGLLGSIWPAGAESASVSIQGFAFNPSSLSLESPATITWTNFDGVAHTVTSDNGDFHSGTLPNGATYTLTLSDPGIYPYRCAFHPYMTASITVTVPGPELIIESIQVVDLNVINKRITVTVRNIGQDTAGASDAQLGYVYKDTFRPLTTSAVPSLGSNGTASFTFDWNTTGKVGSFVLKAIADSSDKVDEAREDNNTLDRSTTILLPTRGVDVFEP